MSVGACRIWKSVTVMREESSRERPAGHGKADRAGMNNLYLSPHLDDAILSCGGLIHRQRSVGESVAVMTLCAGCSDYDHLSRFAEQRHNAWGNPPDLVGNRRAEDAAVLGSLGVSAFYGNTPDGIYRSIGNEVIYPDGSALSGDPHPQELASLPGLWQQEVEDSGFNAEETTVFAPLAAGNHVDHQLVRALAFRLINAGWQTWLFEDYPHVEMSAGALAVAKSWFGPVTWRSEIVRVDVNAKIAAIGGYQTQVRALFGNERAMALRVKRFTADTARGISWMERARSTLVGSRGPCERLWRVVLGYHAHAERIWTYV